MKQGGRTTVSALLAGLLACSCEGAPVAEEGCRPAFLRAGEQPIHVELFGGHSEITAQAAIVGCQSDLDALTEEQLETIRDTIKALLNVSVFRGFDQGLFRMIDQARAARPWLSIVICPVGQGVGGGSFLRS
jgi:hypothetical protein